jgi:large subunit ribosomal protein L11
MVVAETKVISVLVMGGEATAGQPLGPALGPLGVNVLAIVNEINRITGDFKGMRVPVKVEVDTETKKFTVTVGTPTTSALLVKEAGVPKGSGKPNLEFVGNVSFDKVLSIAKVKINDSYAKSIKSSAKEVVGSCVSLGLKVEDQDPRLFMKEIEDGKWDKTISDFEAKR